MGTPHKRLFTILVNILLAFNLLAVISILFSYGAQYINPHDAWIFALFGLLYPYLLFLNLLFVILWLFIRKRYALISLIAILIGWKNLSTIITLPSDEPILLPGPSINLTTWNVHGFAGQMNVRGNVRPEIIEYISDQNPDLLCMQEVRIYEASVDPVFQKMSRSWDLPYHYGRDYFAPDQTNGFNGIVTFSRFPIVRAGFLDQQPKKCFGIFTDIVVGSDTLRIINVHLASLRLDQSDVDFYYHLKKTETEKIRIKAGIFSILRKLKVAFILRAAQTAKILELIDQSTYPVLLCGDMNDSPFSYTYRQLTSSLTDAYREAGKGFFGSTYDGALPNYRIDYILLDRHYKTIAYRKADVTFSDHYPISGLMIVTH